MAFIKVYTDDGKENITVSLENAPRLSRKHLMGALMVCGLLDVAGIWLLLHMLGIF